jgi:hypothetical protein
MRGRKEEGKKRQQKKIYEKEKQTERRKMAALPILFANDFFPTTHHPGQ